MRVRFFGAAGEVTGSRHLLEFDGRQVLLDCGMIQGGGDEDAENAAAFEFEPAGLAAVVISHAHIDHIGRLPLLVKRGYRGPIHIHRASAELARIMLNDSASLARRDIESENRRRRRAGKPLLEPLYDSADVADTLRQMRPLDYDHEREVLPGLTLKLHDAGHIIGSAIVELRGDTGGATRTLVFSGDIGPRSAPFLPDPTPVAHADLLLLESTYGDRNHRSRADTVRELGSILAEARRDGGNVLIPAFAVGRSQELLYWFAKHFEEWELDRWDIFLDSPMAVRVIDVYRNHAHLFDGDDHHLFAPGRGPFGLPNLRLVSQVQDSMALNRRASGCIIIAGSGMCNGGRILHHLKHNLWRKECDLVFVGFQARGTLGRRLVDGARHVTIYGEPVAVNARLHTVGGLSAHADQTGLLNWYGHFANRPPVALVHGEDPAREALAARLQSDYGATTRLVHPGDSMTV